MNKPEFYPHVLLVILIRMLMQRRGKPNTFFYCIDTKVEGSVGFLISQVSQHQS